MTTMTTCRWNKFLTIEEDRHLGIADAGPMGIDDLSEDRKLTGGAIVRTLARCCNPTGRNRRTAKHI